MQITMPVYYFNYFTFYLKEVYPRGYTQEVGFRPEKSKANSRVQYCNEIPLQGASGGKVWA